MSDYTHYTQKCRRKSCTGAAAPQEILFLWRPFLRDADDDMVLELALAAGCQHIITHNVRDFAGSEQLGVSAITPREFLRRIRKTP
jgi:predicted nucleic acid-binding protein